MLSLLAKSGRGGLGRLILDPRRLGNTCLLSGKCFSSQTFGQDDRSLFVVNVEGRRNTSPILLGLFEHFETLFGPRVGFFQPIAGEPFPGSTGSRAPRHVELIRAAFGLKDGPEHMVGLSRRQVVDMLAAGQEEELMDAIYARYESYAHDKEMVLVEGTHIDGPIYTPGNRLELNAKVAANLAAPFLMVLDAKQDSADDLLSRSLICKNTIEGQRARVLGLMLNQVRPADRLEALTAELKASLEPRGLKLLGGLPQSPLLASTRLDEIQRSLQATQLQSHGRVDVGVDKVFMASGTLDSCLSELAVTKSERCLVACDSSRSDLLLGLEAAHNSVPGPHLAGVLVCQGEAINPRVIDILEGGGVEGSQLPLLATELSASDAFQEISRIAPDILPSSARKIEESKALFNRYTDVGALDVALEAREEAVVTPKRFMRIINHTCEASPQHIVLPEGTEARILRAAAEVTRKGLAHITLLGEPAAVQAEARRIAVDISACNIVDHRHSEKTEEYAELLVKERQHKGMTLDKARDLLLDPNYYGTLMAASGDADGMVSGSTTTTANTIRPALQVLKTKGSLVSSVFFMCLPTKVLVYGDCAVNTDPKPEELAKIGIVSADTAAAFGIQPLVAFLSYSTLGSGSGPDVEKVAKAVEIAKSLRPDLEIEGPIQYDAAVDPEVARTKVKGDSKVAGRATVLIVPDLNVGNIVYKAVQQSTGAIAIGPILQGLTKPVNDLSRGCTVGDIINTITCTEVQAAALENPAPASEAAPAA